MSVSTEFISEELSGNPSDSLEHEATRRMYQRLVTSHDKSLNYNDIIKRDIEGSRTFQDVFCCDDPIYTDQIEIIKLNQPSTVIADTVGSYLYGCFQPEKEVEVICTPACIKGLRNPKTIEDCSFPVYEKKDNLLTKLNVVAGNNQGLVFVASGQTVTAEDIKLLQKDVQTITTYLQDENTLNYQLGETLDLNSTSTLATADTSTTTEEPSNWIWVWVIIVVILIILFVLMLSL
jgi:hypothetical protein